VDRVIAKKKWSRKRILTIAGIVGVAALIAGSIYFTSGKSRLNVEADRLTISEVKQGVFQENIPVNGMVLPLTSIYLDAQEGGRVEEKYVEDGAVMKKGDPILRLTNTDLMMTMVTQQSTVFNTLTQMQINRNAAQQNTVGKLNSMADVESMLTEAKRLYNLNRKLYDQKAIGLQEFKKSENDYNYYSEKSKLTKRILQADSLSTKQQMVQDRQSYDAAQNALSLMQKKVGDLVVRAPVDGQLTSLDAEIGQSKNKGERLGQLDVVGGFKVRVDVDEHYLARVYTGLSATVPLSGKEYKLKITKVYTQITGGRFQVDMEFDGEVPAGIRRGQTLQILLALSEERKALLLAKGGFYQTTGGNWVFKVREDGRSAFRVNNVQLGNQNRDYYEVVGGLQSGDKIITSSYENYGTMEELILKK